MAPMLLLEYLQRPLTPPQVVVPRRVGKNTTSKLFSYKDIKSLQIWEDFNYDNIMQEFQDVLMQAGIEDDSLAPSLPQRTVNSENLVRAEVCEILRPRIGRALRAGFTWMATSGRIQGHSTLSFNTGKAAKVIQRCEPDLAFFDITANIGNTENRVPGDIKPLYKWNSTIQNAPNTSFLQNEFRQVLSQTNLYMKQHGGRYGFIVTDQEFMAIEQVDKNGNLQISQAIPWTASGTIDEPQLTVSLALWYLGILGSYEDDWQARV